MVINGFPQNLRMSFRYTHTHTHTHTHTPSGTKLYNFRIASTHSVCHQQKNTNNNLYIFGKIFSLPLNFEFPLNLPMYTFIVCSSSLVFALSAFSNYFRAFASSCSRFPRIMFSLVSKRCS